MNATKKTRTMVAVCMAAPHISIRHLIAAFCRVVVIGPH
jgi:hypothetical protein